MKEVTLWKENQPVSRLRPTFRLRTPAQQAAWKSNLQGHLATYQRPDFSGWGTPERCVGAFRREYEHMPLKEFFGGLYRLEGNYHVTSQQLPAGYYKTPLLIERDVATAAGIWRSVRNEWVAAWLAEAREKFGLDELPEATPQHTDVLPGIPWQPGGPRGLWLAAPWEWPVPAEWTRETPGVFEVYENDLEELRRLPHNLDGVGSCEPGEFEVMALPDRAALSRIILALFGLYGPDGLLTHSRQVERVEWQKDGQGLEIGTPESVFYTRIAFDCRPWLKPEFMEGGPYHG